jgi:hypothetical protein
VNVPALLRISRYGIFLTVLLVYCKSISTFSWPFWGLAYCKIAQNYPCIFPKLHRCFRLCLAVATFGLIDEKNKSSKIACLNPFNVICSRFIGTYFSRMFKNRNFMFTTTQATCKKNYTLLSNYSTKENKQLNFLVRCIWSYPF